jgi:hypothetical protein
MSLETKSEKMVDATNPTITIPIRDLEQLSKSGGNFISM